MTDQPKDGDQTYYEQQLEILLSNAPEMERFPAEQLILFGRQLNRRTVVVLVDSIHRSSMVIEQAIKLATSQYGWHCQGPFSDPSYEWNDVIWAAQQWYLNHMTQEQATELNKLLLEIPYLEQIPIRKLYQLCIDESWPKYESIQCGTGPSPVYVDAIGLLQDAYKSLQDLEFREDGSIYIIVQDSLIKKPRWTLAFLAVAAWSELHQPCFDTPAPLPEDPAERLDLLCNEIRELGNCATYDARTLFATLRELDVPDTIYGIYTSVESRTSVSRSLTDMIELAAHTDCSHYGQNLAFYCERTVTTFNVPEALSKVFSAFAHRRSRLALKISWG